MEIANVTQYSPEWWALRKLKLTASKASAIAAAGKGLETYCTQLVQEYFSKAEPISFSNIHTERGHELEDSARFLYSLQTGLEVQQVGFVSMSDWAGCSPDGLVGDYGLVEIKCPADPEYFRILLGGAIKSDYVWQMQMQMLVCQRAWCDSVVYNPNYERELIIQRFDADPASHRKLIDGIEIGTQMIKSLLQTAQERINGQ